VAPVAVPELGYKPTLGEAIGRAARLYGDRDFVVLPDRRITFAEADRASKALAKRMLSAGIGKGTRVGLFYTYSVEWVVAWLAASRIGALVMPFSTIYAPGELRTVLRLGDVSTLILGPTMLGRDMAAFLEEAVPGLRGSPTAELFLAELPYLRSVWITGATDRSWARSEPIDKRPPAAGPVTDGLLAAVEDNVAPADLATIVYTSGSSALPKGVVHSHSSIVRTTAAFGTLASEANPDAAVFCAFPFFWIGGFLVLGGALHSGLTVCCLERFEPEAALDMVEKERCGMVAAWPSLIQSMRTHPTFQGRNLEHCPMLVSGPSDVALANSPVPGIPGHRGMTETIGNWNGVERKIIDPVTGDDLPEREEGELLIRGYGVTQGYYKKEREEVFDADGWLHTGDRCFMVDNRPFFVGRFYEMIKTRGANVAPREVELVLEAFPDIAHALVFGLPHAVSEEEVAAVVVPAPGAHLDAESIQERAREQLSSYKVPTRIHIVADESAVPWLASGKPDKRTLQARFQPASGSGGANMAITETGGEKS
jgi:acyl-CoA synthetase (AMP-forming)/AMP-acid ligase II